MLAIFGAFLLYTVALFVIIFVIEMIIHLRYINKVKNSSVGTVFYSKECVNNPFESKCSFVTIEEVKKNDNGDYYVLIKDQDGTENVMEMKELFNYYTTKSKYHE